MRAVRNQVITSDYQVDLEQRSVWYNYVLVMKTTFNGWTPGKVVNVARNRFTFDENWKWDQHFCWPYFDLPAGIAPDSPGVLPQAPASGPAAPEARSRAGKE